MKDKIIINGTDFYYDREDLSYSHTHAMSHVEAQNILFKAKELLDSKGLRFFLAYGTLLGAIREHGFIKGDEDVDIAVDNEEHLISIIPYLEENDLHLIRVIPGNTYTFRTNEDCYIDMYILRPIFRFSIWSLYCYALCNLKTPKKYFKEYDKMEFLGKDFCCPKNPEKLIEFWYGKSWRTPVRGHKFYYEVKSAYYWRLYIAPYLKKIVLFDKWHK